MRASLPSGMAKQRGTSSARTKQVYGASALCWSPVLCTGPMESLLLPCYTSFLCTKNIAACLERRPLMLTPSGDFFWGQLAPSPPPNPPFNITAAPARPRLLFYPAGREHGRFSFGQDQKHPPCTQKSSRPIRVRSYLSLTQRSGNTRSATSSFAAPFTPSMYAWTWSRSTTGSWAFASW